MKGAYREFLQIVRVMCSFTTGLQVSLTVSPGILHCFGLKSKLVSSVKWWLWDSLNCHECPREVIDCPGMIPTRMHVQISAQIKIFASLVYHVHFFLHPDYFKPRKFWGFF